MMLNEEWRIGITVVLLAIMTGWAIGVALGWLFTIVLLAVDAAVVLILLHTYNPNELAVRVMVILLVTTLVAGIISASLTWGIWGGLMLVLAWGIRFVSS